MPAALRSPRPAAVPTETDRLEALARHLVEAGGPMTTHRVASLAAFEAIVRHHRGPAAAPASPLRAAGAG